MTPGEAAAKNQDEVVSMVDYLRDTIADIDTVVGEWQAHRTTLALRLAALEAATDPAVQAAVDDYSQRVAEDRPYEQAEGANALLSEAQRRFVQ